MKIYSDNPATEKALTKLVKTMQDNGTWFHEDIALSSVNNGLLVELNGACNPTDPVIKMPTKQLVRVDALDMRLEGNDFAITPDEKKLSPVQIALAEQMIEIYNLTSRPAFHREECAWIRYRKAPKLLKTLSKARTLANRQSHKMSYTVQEAGCAEDGEFLCDTFWQSRVLGHRESSDAEPIQKVMPFIDFLDHHYTGSPFVMPKNDKMEQVMRIQNQRPFLGNNVLYATYGMYDALDTLLTYGFTDTECPFVRAVPMKIRLDSDTSLIINSLTASKAKAPLNQNLKDLVKYSPVVSKDEKGNLQVSHMQIPVLQAPNAMRRILRSLIHTAVKDKASPQFVIDLTYKVERDIVENTIAFYKDAMTKIEKDGDAPQHLKDDAANLCKVQLAKLYKYYYNENFFALRNESEATAENQAAQPTSA